MSSKQDGECETQGIAKLTEKETKLDQLVEQVFSIPLILKEILRNLGKLDLLRTSLVNKNWNFFSREVIRDSITCPIMFEPKCACYNLRKLNLLVLKSETLPFNGIFIPGSSNPNLQCLPDTDLSGLIGIVLRKITGFQLLAIDYGWEEQFSPCMRKFIREIVLRKGNSVLGLGFDNTSVFSQSFSEITGLDSVGQRLPNLQTLKVPFELFSPDLPMDLIQDLVKETPKLQKLYGRINSACLEFIVPLNLSIAVKEFFLSAKINTLKNSLAFAMKSPKLEKFMLLSYDEWDDDREVFSQWEESSRQDFETILKNLLNSSKDSLKKVAFRHSDLILVTHQWNIPVLEKATHMSLMYCESIDVKEGFSTLRKVDWEKYFPNLREVFLSNRVDSALDSAENRDFYIGNSFRDLNAQFVCGTVTKLSWHDGYRDSTRQMILMFKSIFPNVKEFCLQETEMVASFLNVLWTSWTDLEAIYVSYCIYPFDNNFDFVFLGVAKEEAAYLLQNVEDFRSLEIVPTAPCIFNLRKLKKIVIHLLHDHESVVGEIIPHPESFFLSRLAGQCAFSRVPGLVVEICPEVCKEKDSCGELNLQHLESFANLMQFGVDDFGVTF